MRELKGDWRDIFLGFSIARDPRKIFLATVGFIVSLALIAVLVNIGGWVDLVEDHNVGLAMKWVRAAPVRLPLAMADHPKATIGNVLGRLASISWSRAVWRKVVFLVPVGLILLLVWSRIAAGICRIAAIEFAKDERIEMRDARKFAKKKWLSLFWAPIVPLLGMLVFALAIVMGGVIGTIPGGVGTLIVGAFMGLALIAGFLITLILIGGIAGFYLMFPAISAEGTDAFDGISRAYSYVYTKPWRFIFYTVVSAAYWLACTVFVFLFVWLMVEVTLRIGYVGMHAFSRSGRVGWDAIYLFYRDFGRILHKQHVMPLGHIGAVLGGITCNLAFCAAWGFAISMALTNATIVYFLMRKAVDGSELSEIYIEEEEEDFEEEVTESEAEEKVEEAEPEEEEAEEEKKPKPRKTTRRKKSSKKT